MRIEKLVLRVGGTSMLLGALALVASMLTGTAALRTLAMGFLATGVLVAFLPLLGLIAYTFLEKFRKEDK